MMSEAFLFCAIDGYDVEVISRRILFLLFIVALIVGIFGLLVAFAFSSFQFLIYSAVNLSLAGFFGYKINRRHKNLPKRR
jgi:hypothetical protein